MDYSLSKRKMSVGPHTGKEVFVASAVCQKHHITFDELCERMADDSTVGQADIAAVFYRFRKVLNQLCSQGFIVDGGPLGTFRPTFTSKAVLKEEDFRDLILDHYSFLKRPVFLTEKEIFVGSEKKNLENLKIFFENKNDTK